MSMTWLCDYEREFAIRFWSKVSVNGTCWDWTASKSTNGYGRVRSCGRPEYAHRVAYEMLVGRIPHSMQIDHLCRNRLCVNPAHLDLVTSRENTLRGMGISAFNSRKTHCVNGHQFDSGNTRIEVCDGRPRRKCIPCIRSIRRRAYLKRCGRGMAV